MSMIDASTAQSVVPQTRQGLRVRNFRGKLFVASQGQAFELSDTAAFIYRAIDGERSVAEIGRQVAAEYGIPFDTAVEDTVELLTALSEAEVLDLNR
ncbi:PqqD family protein [Micromonospora marina]|uniref:Pyrroloquinoline quinone biosynthesis protein D n=1 Tax=Micromonospora marina TaxID=307120 RepID=A0A1C5A8X1_9ACTN|nr:PqqD family protein [Micromonospora marina]SCF41635.1 pyrroloquinoline quinone biosynthesis protein D [Micromonospora marina]